MPRAWAPVNAQECNGLQKITGPLTKRILANQSFQLGVKNARVNPYKYSFFIRIVKEWNNLPQCVVEAESFKLFKARLKSFLNM